jgi:predicted ArsR family transcriptional regulator
VHSVRKHILQILKESEGSTVAELAEKLGMAPVSVRHHLDILQGDNLICVERVERKGYVGRPQQVYALTPEASDYFPNNFAALAGNLARQLKQVLPPEQVRCAFRAMAHEIAGELDPRQLQDAPLETRLERVTEFLNERGYLAHWESATADPEDGYLLHKCNCPYAGVSAEHRELCLMDQALIDELVGQPCVRTHSMIENDHCCTYRIQQAVRSEIPLLVSDEEIERLSREQQYSTLPNKIRGSVDCALARGLHD